MEGHNYGLRIESHPKLDTEKKTNGQNELNKELTQVITQNEFLKQHVEDLRQGCQIYLTKCSFDVGYM